MSYFPAHIEAMAGYVPGEQPADLSVIKLNTNENPYPPSPKVLEAILSLGGEQLRRYPNYAGEAFREAAGRLHGVSPEMVLCGNGADDVLNIIVRTLTDADRPIGWPTPTYTLCETLAQLHRVPVRSVPWPADYSLPADALVKLGAAVTYVCNPNSPTGTFVAAEEIAALADRLDGVLVVDEAYVDFAESNCMGLAASRANVLVVRTLSKGYSLAGLRFGYAVGHADLIAGLMKAKDSYNVDALSIAAATAAVEDQAYRDACVAKVVTERGRLSAGLRAMGMDVLASQANFVLARCDRPGAADVYAGLKDRGILVRYFASPGLDDRLRITVGTAQQNDALLRELKAIIGSTD